MGYIIFFSKLLEGNCPSSNCASYFQFVTTNCLKITFSSSMLYYWERIKIKQSPQNQELELGYSLITILEMKYCELVSFRSDQKMQMLQLIFMNVTSSGLFSFFISTLNNTPTLFLSSFTGSSFKRYWKEYSLYAFYSYNIKKSFKGYFTVVNNYLSHHFLFALF